MTTTGGRGAALVMVGLLSLCAVAAPATRACGVERVDPPGGELLALNDQRFLVWDDRGALSFGDSKGGWTVGARLPFEQVWKVVPDGPGFLVSGAPKPGVEAIVLFDGQAREIRRWKMSESSFELFVEAGHRWAVRRTGLVELLSTGALGPLVAFRDGDAVRRHYHPPRLFQDGDSRLICWGADRTKLHDAPGICERADSERWVVPRAGSEPPVRCGPWLVARVGRDQRELVVLSLHGAAAGHRAFSTPPVFACAGPDHVVIGAREVEVAELPSLASRWSHRTVGRRMHAVAAVTGAVAYETEGSRGVIILPR